MLIGAISDTHDNLPQVEKAVKYLNDQKVAWCFTQETTLQALSFQNSNN